MFIHRGISVRTHTCYIVHVLYSVYVSMCKCMSIYVCGVYMRMCDICVCTQTYIERDGFNLQMFVCLKRSKLTRRSWGDI